jgi:hypothetical protein
MHQVAFLPRDRGIGLWRPLLGSTAPILEILRKFPANADKNISRQQLSPQVPYL